MERLTDKLDDYDFMEVRAASRRKAIALLHELKNVEEEKLKNGELIRVEIMNGYAMTKYPQRYKED
jgi:hypothetical protein